MPIVGIVISDADKAELVAFAKSKGLSFSAFCRMTCLEAARRSGA